MLLLLGGPKMCLFRLKVDKNQSNWYLGQEGHLYAEYIEVAFQGHLFILHRSKGVRHI